MLKFILTFFVSLTLISFVALAEEGSELEQEIAKEAEESLEEGEQELKEIEEAVAEEVEKPIEEAETETKEEKPEIEGILKETYPEMTVISIVKTGKEYLNEEGKPVKEVEEIEEGIPNLYALMLPDAMQELNNFAKEKNLKLVGPPRCIYFSPTTAPPSEWIIELQMPFEKPEEEIAGTEKILIKTIPVEEVICKIHIGPYDEVGTVYEILPGEINKMGYIMAGPPFEEYLNDPDEVPPEELQTKICFPVAKMPEGLPPEMIQEEEKEE